MARTLYGKLVAALFALVLSINLLGDGIRDVTAPENIS